MQRLKAIRLRFRNFMSFGNQWTEINFEDSTSTFIYGENIDTNTRNGAGKTSILNAIVYAVYNRAFDNITLPRLINITNAAKNTLMEVEYLFSKGSDIYEIKRKRGESHGVTLEENGIDITPDSINETDALIERIYGRSYELFTRVIVFAGNTTPFLDLPVSLQRAHIEELFNITVLSEKAQKLKKVIQTSESDAKVEEALLKERETSSKLKQKRLAEFEQKVISWEEQKEAKLISYRKQLASVEGIDFTNERELFERKTKLSEEQQRTSSTKASLTRAKERLDKDIATLLKQQQHLEDDKCPYCLQNMADAASKLHDIEEKLLALVASLEEHEEKLATETTKLTNIQAELKEVNESMTYDNLPVLLDTLANMNTLQVQLRELELAENPYFETYEQMESEVNESSISYEKLDELKSTIEHQQFLLKLLTDKNSFLRRRIISRTIPFLNLRMNTYAKQLGLPHVIQFKDDMTCMVSQYGRELDFGNLSAGEKKRVNLAMSLAFRDVLHHLHAKDNLLFVDEIDASLCASGVESVVALLNQKTKEDELSTWVIMHREGVEDKFDRKMLVIKENGFSTVSLQSEECK
jgi:DNA repair exonuclease SbcCD ATPase subunit